MKRMIAVAAAVQALMGPAYAEAPGVSDHEIRIGEILPLTGPASFAGKAHYLGTKIALA